MAVKKKIDIIGVPSDLGANMNGANMGPSAIRIAGLKKQVESLGYEVRDLGDITVPVKDSLPQSDHDARFLQPITDICKELANITLDSYESNHTPIVLGGDHSIAVGTISGASAYFRKRNQKMGLVWVDAHADCNTPTSSPSGNIHGMPLSTLLDQGHSCLREIGGPGSKVDADKVALIGIRTIDDVEKKILRESGIQYYSMRDIDEQGMYQIMKKAIAAVSKDTAGIHLSFDIDGIDPNYAPGVSTPVGGGLSFREAHLLLEMLCETEKLTSLEFVELNPFTDVGAQTANLVVDLIQSALGKTIV